MESVVLGLTGKQPQIRQYLTLLSAVRVTAKHKHLFIRMTPHAWRLR